MKNLFFLPNLEGGGAQRVVLNLVSGFAAQKNEVVLVVAIPSGALLNEVPNNIKLIHLNLSRSSRAILPLMKVIKSEKPDCIYSIMNYANIITCIACLLAGTKAKIILLIANTLTQYQYSKKINSKALLMLERLWYNKADFVIANSKDTYDDLLNAKLVKPHNLKLIYNPVINFDDIAEKTKEPANHPWLQNKTAPVLISVGRLTRQKNFQFLIKSFAELKKMADTKLIILGEGQLRGELEELIHTYNLQDDISMPGFVTNPYPFYKEADVFVLTSLWEGFGNVIVEAMACGCPIIASNCPGGPKEILEWGKYGALIDGYDEVQFAEAVLFELKNKTDMNLLISRAGDFTIDKIAKELAELASAL